MDTASARVRHIAMELAGLSESALAYCTDRFDIGRFHRIGALAEELMDEISAEPRPAYDQEVATVAGYTTPKLDVRGGVFDDGGRVLLVQEIADSGRWTLPGGWCDILEAPGQAVEREVREEAGVPVRAAHLAAVFDRDRWPHEPRYDRHLYKLFFVCEPLGPVDTTFTSDETSEVGWFDVDDLPPLSVERVLAQQIEILQQHWHSPGPAYFD